MTDTDDTTEPSGGGAASGGDGDDRDAEPRYLVDGEVLPASEATVSVRDRGFMYGDAAFETLRVYDRQVFEWSAHLDRLHRTCDRLAIDHGIGDSDLRIWVQDVVEANDFDDAYVRLSISRGVQPGKLTPSPEVDPTVVVIATELPRGGTEGESVWDGPAVARTVATRKVPDEAIPADVKTHNYLNGILARLELDAEADEALMLDTSDHVVEGATSNLFLMGEDALHTPNANQSLLPGVTRKVVMDLARDAGIPVETRRYTPRQIREAEEAFLTNTTWEIRPVESIDGTEVGGGPVTDLLRHKFDRLVEDRHY